MDADGAETAWERGCYNGAMKYRWTLFLTSLLLLSAFFLVRSEESFLEGFGYALLIGACLIQLVYLIRFIVDYRKRRTVEG